MPDEDRVRSVAVVVTAAAQAVVELGSQLVARSMQSRRATAVLLG